MASRGLSEERRSPTAPGKRLSPPLSASSNIPVMLTAGEVAVALRTSRKAVYAMIERAQLPGIVRIGRRVLVRQDALLDFLDHNSASSPQETRR